MSPLLILIVALTVVIGGVLALRLHAFLTLIVGALVVAALTPAASIERHELRAAGVRIDSVSGDGRHATMARSRQKLYDGGVYEVHRALDGAPAARIGWIRVTAGAGAMAGEVTSLTEGQKLQPGDLVLSPEKSAAVRGAAGKSIGERVAVGFGETALSIGIVIAMASILGQCLLDSRGAERIVYSTQKAIGVKRTPLAFLTSGFLLGIPVFAEAVFYLLFPLAKAMWVQTRKNYILYVLTIVAGATMTHSLVPPTPGPLFTADALGVSIGDMIIWGSLVGLCAALAGYAYALWANRRWDIPLRESAGLAAVESRALQQQDPSTYPPLTLALLPILLPVILISGDSAFDAYERSELSPAMQDVARMFAVLGDKNLALTLAAGVAILTMLVQRRRMEPGAIRKSIGAAVVEGGEIVLVIAAGGALGYTLRQAGMAELVHAVTPEWKLALLPMAWGITAVIRIAQGSATVAMITAVGIVAPIALHSPLSYDAVYLACAIGCGSKIGMWMNDAGFWVITKMSGFREGETLKTASVMIFIEGTVGLIATMIFAWLFPLV